MKTKKAKGKASCRKKAAEPEPALGLVWPLVPSDDGDSLTDVRTWRTACGHYCVRRAVNRCGVGDRFLVGYKRRVVQHDGHEYVMEDFLKDPDRGGNYPKEFRKLEDALAAAARLYCRRAGEDDVTTNAAEVLKAAGDLARLPRTEKDVAKAAARATRPQREKAPRSPREDGPRDRFGCREGTDAALAVAVLTSTPMKMAEVVKQGGLKGTVYNHLNRLVAEGKVLKSAAGYSLPAGK